MKSSIASLLQNRDFIRVGRSRIEGTGVFAKRKIPKGTRIIEYTGKRLSREKLFVEMNDARFINHSCEPNCEAYIFNERVYLYAMRDITRGEELSFDYQLTPAFGTSQKKSRKDAYLCLCGSKSCRGTMLAKRNRQRI
jgi:SET domain-containing protein